MDAGTPNSRSAQKILTCIMCVGPIRFREIFSLHDYSGKLLFYSASLLSNQNCVKVLFTYLILTRCSLTFKGSDFVIILLTEMSARAHGCSAILNST